MPDARDVWAGQLKAWGLDTPEIQDLLTRSVTETMSSEGLKAELFKTNTFNQSFPEYQASIQAGHPMDPGTILEYRQNVKSVMFNAGIPSGFYDSNQDYADLIGKGVSAKELSDRVLNGFDKVAHAPQEVKDVFNSYFGAQGEAALATFFLDPSKGSELLTKMATQGEIGGAGKRFGFDVNVDQAGRLAELGVDARSAQQGFEQAKTLNPLTQETISETQDLTSQDTINTVFGVGGDSAEQVKRRQQERSAAFQGGGGAAQTQGGLGVGQAR